MVWSYRIVEKTCKQTGEGTQGIYEVYYDDNGEPSSVTETPVSIQWEVGASTYLVLKRIQKAFDKEVLSFDDFESKTPF